MIALAWVISVVAAALAGYHYRKLHDVVMALDRARRKLAKPKPSSTLIEGDDPVAIARLEMERRHKALQQMKEEDENMR